MPRWVAPLALLLSLASLGLAWATWSELRATRDALRADGLLGVAADPFHPPRRANATDPIAQPPDRSSPADPAEPAGGPTGVGSRTERGPLLVGLASPEPSASLPTAGEAPIEELVAKTVDAKLTTAVDEAIRKGVNEVLARQDKKPTIERFAEVLHLDDAQRATVAHEVVGAQKSIVDALSTPMRDGTVPLDELVDLMAEGMRRPGEDVGWGRFLSRLLAEPFAGTRSTYAQHVDGIKADLKTSLRRSLNDAQWSSFEAWQMDPTEIGNVPGSPYGDILQRVQERAGTAADR